MDPELKKGFQELQTQVLESRSKISHIELCQKRTSLDAKVIDSILEDYVRDGNVENKFFYQQIGRMLVKQEGEEAHKFLKDRQKLLKERLKQYSEVKEVCINRVKESEDSLRELVNKKLNKVDQSNSKQEPKTTEKKDPEPTNSSTAAEETKGSN